MKGSKMDNATRELTLVIALVGFFFLAGLVAFGIFLRVMIKESRIEKNRDSKRDENQRTENQG